MNPNPYKPQYGHMEADPLAAEQWRTPPQTVEGLGDGVWVFALPNMGCAMMGGGSCRAVVQVEQTTSPARAKAGTDPSKWANIRQSPRLFSYSVHINDQCVVMNNDSWFVFPHDCQLEIRLRRGMAPPEETKTLAVWVTLQKATREQGREAFARDLRAAVRDEPAPQAELTLTDYLQTMFGTLAATVTDVVDELEANHGVTPTHGRAIRSTLGVVLGANWSAFHGPPPTFDRPRYPADEARLFWNEFVAEALVDPAAPPIEIRFFTERPPVGGMYADGELKRPFDPTLVERLKEFGRDEAEEGDS